MTIEIKNTKSENALFPIFTITPNEVYNDGLVHELVNIAAVQKDRNKQIAFNTWIEMYNTKTARNCFFDETAPFRMLSLDKKNGHEASVRVALFAAQAIFPVVESLYLSKAHLARAAIEAAKNWLLNPCTETVQLAQTASENLSKAFTAHSFPTSWWPAQHAAKAVMSKPQFERCGPDLVHYDAAICAWGAVGRAHEAAQEFSYIQDINYNRAESLQFFTPPSPREFKRLFKIEDALKFMEVLYGF
jgi:hypothetical protein